MRWEGRPLLLCTPRAHPLEPAQRPEGCFLPPSTFFHPCDRMAANMLCLHLCHVSGPFINCHISEFTHRTAVAVSFYAGVTPPKKGFAFTSRATWEIVVSLICSIWKHNPLSLALWGITFRSIPPNCSEGTLHSSFTVVQNKQSPFRRVSREPKPFSPSKITSKLVCSVFLHH